MSERKLRRMKDNGSENQSSEGHKHKEGRKNKGERNGNNTYEYIERNMPKTRWCIATVSAELVGAPTNKLRVVAQNRLEQSSPSGNAFPENIREHCAL